jgi:transcription antitermination factor NusG
LIIGNSFLVSQLKKWYAVYTKPRWEKKVHALFNEKHLESYCPLNKVRKKWSDRMKIVEEPLFKSYVFVQITEEEKIKVRMTNGVVNFVYWQGKPAVIKEKEINIIKKFLHEYENVTAEPIHLKSDMKIRIQQGLLMDNEAKIIKVLGKKVQVMIESIGYSLVAFIDKSNVAVVQKQ